jgi:hypothetical protein
MITQNRKERDAPATSAWTHLVSGGGRRLAISGPLPYSRSIPRTPKKLSFLTLFSLIGNHCSLCSWALGSAFAHCVVWRRLATFSSKSTTILIVVREIGFTPTISTLAVAVSRWRVVRSFSRVCVGSSSRDMISSLTERRSRITVRRPSPVLAARVPEAANDDCETTDAQLLTCMLDGVVGAFTD